MLTVERLRETLDYDPRTGVFVWKISPARSVQTGDVAGCLDRNGYVRVTVAGRAYLAHRLAWFYHYGEWPKRDLDHRDRMRNFNAIDNLREADRSQNKANGSNQQNATGFRGVRHNGAKFVATIKWRRQRYHVGTFDTPEEAYAAYCAKAAELFGDFAP